MRQTWSVVVTCPECGEQTLREFWRERDGEEPKRTDEFCDNPACTRGEQAGIPART